MSHSELGVVTLIRTRTRDSDSIQNFEESTSLLFDVFHIPAPLSPTLMPNFIVDYARELLKNVYHLNA